MARVGAQEQDEAGEETIALIVQLLGESDKDMRSIGLEQVRSGARGQAATLRFAAVLPNFPPESQAGLISALARRADSAARPAIIDQLGSADSSVRAAAAEALGYLGLPEDVDRLLALIQHPDAATRDQVRAALVRIPGDEASKALAAALRREPAGASSAQQRIAMMEILTQRRAAVAAGNLLPLAVDADPAVRRAAMSALGELGGTEHIPDMLAGVLKAERGAEREAAEKAVMFVCSRQEDVDQRAAPVLAAIARLPATDQELLWPTLGRVGGATALGAIEPLISAPRTHNIGLRAICNWPDASIAPRLIQLAESDAHPDHRTMALRALARVAVLTDDRTDAERLELLQQVWKMCTRDADRLLVLQRASAVRTVDSLRFLLPMVDQATLMEQACLSIVELAHHRALREAHKDEFHAALDKVMATSKDATTLERARRYKTNQTWNRRSP